MFDIIVHHEMYITLVNIKTDKKQNRYIEAFGYRVIPFDNSTAFTFKF